MDAREPTRNVIPAHGDAVIWGNGSGGEWILGGHEWLIQGAVAEPRTAVGKGVGPALPAMILPAVPAAAGVPVEEHVGFVQMWMSERRDALRRM